MLKPRKRITKRQIKEDKFVTYYFKTTDFIQQYSRQIIWAVSGIAVVFIVFFIYSKKRAEKEQNAIVDLTKSKVEYFNNNYESAVNILQNLVDSYGDTKSGKTGAFYLANAYFNLEKYDEAEKYFKEYLDGNSDDILEASAISGVASCLEEQGKFAEAAEMYEKAADQFSDGFMAPDNLFNSARCLVLAKDTEAASIILYQVLEKYSESQIKNDAEILLAEINL